MYKPKRIVHVEDYFMQENIFNTKNAKYKVNPNDIICLFFDENGHPITESMPTCDEIIEKLGIEMPSNKAAKHHYRQKIQTVICNVVNHLSEVHQLNILQVHMNHDRRIHYGFSNDLSDQAASVEKKIRFHNSIDKRVKQRQSITEPAALQLIETKKINYA
jgi:hypothetical protein